MGRVAATEFKARCLELMDRVAERSESYVIAPAAMILLDTHAVFWAATHPDRTTW